MLSLAITAALGCSPATPNVGEGGGGSKGDGGAGQGTTTTDDGNLGFGGAGEGGSGTGNFEECAAASEVASTLPLNLFVAVDKSGSMADNNKWGQAKDAFVGFFQNPANQTEKTRVALRFWPDGDCNATTCNIAACGVPQVPLGPLSDPVQVQSLVNLYNSKSPDGNTPMEAALGGAAKWAIENAQAGEGAEVTAIVFVTDGAPNGCDENINNIAQYAATAYASSKVLTFAVGLAGSNESDMAVISTAGNTMTPFLIGSGDVQAELAAALVEIQKTTLACVFAMPEAQGPDPVDPGKVNLTYTPTSGMPVPVGQVSGEGACGAGWAWYYDDPSNPTIIKLCPQLCDAVQGDENGQIKVVVGCDTKPA